MADIVRLICHQCMVMHDPGENCGCKKTTQPTLDVAQMRAEALRLDSLYGHENAYSSADIVLLTRHVKTLAAAYEALQRNTGCVNGCEGEESQYCEACHHLESNAARYYSGFSNDLSEKLTEAQAEIARLKRDFASVVEQGQQHLATVADLRAKLAAAEKERDEARKWREAHDNLARARRQDVDRLDSDFRVVTDKLISITQIVKAHFCGDDGELTPGQSRKTALRAIAGVLGVKP